VAARGRRGEVEVAARDCGGEVGFRRIARRLRRERQRGNQDPSGEAKPVARPCARTAHGKKKNEGAPGWVRHGGTGLESKAAESPATARQVLRAGAVQRQTHTRGWRAAGSFRAPANPSCY